MSARSPSKGSMLYLGSTRLASQLAQFLTQDLLLIRVDVLVSEEDDSASRDWTSSASVSCRYTYNIQCLFIYVGTSFYIPVIARSRILLLSSRISVNCSSGNSVPITGVTSKLRDSSREPECLSGSRISPERDVFWTLALIPSIVEVGVLVATSTAGAMVHDADCRVQGE